MKPKTIQELQDYCDRNGFEAQKTRFFIGEDYKGAKAFGIYQDEETGEFVVYKNKDNGVRAIRYSGRDEEYAVSELYDRLQAEIVNQKDHYYGHTTTSFSSLYEEDGRSRNHNSETDYLYRDSFSDDSSYSGEYHGSRRTTGGDIWTSIVTIGLVAFILFMIVQAVKGDDGVGSRTSGGSNSRYNSGYSYDYNDNNYNYNYNDYDYGNDSDWGSDSWDSDYTDWGSDW